MIRAIISLLASGVTAVQAIFLYIEGRGVCFNDGCEIVESLTTITPLTFNIVGFLYFQTLFWMLLKGRNGNEYWHKLARLLLLAGLAAEAVLVFFQYRIAMAFCSYCLVIFAIILLLNLLCGLRQIIRGAVLFSAVFLACSSLRFDPAAGKAASLATGSVAKLAGQEDGTDRYLFFSSTCNYCEKILDSIRESNRCSFRFNPVDRIESFQLKGAELSAAYDPAVNAGFLKNLSIPGVPVLVASDKERALVLQGERQIMLYLDENCRTKAKEIEYSGSSSAVPGAGFGGGFGGSSGVQGSAADGSCPVAAECVPEESEDTQEKNGR